MKFFAVLCLCSLALADDQLAYSWADASSSSAEGGQTLNPAYWSPQQPVRRQAFLDLLGGLSPGQLLVPFGLVSQVFLGGLL